MHLQPLLLLEKLRQRLYRRRKLLGRLVTPRIRTKSTYGPQTRRRRISVNPRSRRPPPDVLLLFACTGSSASQKYDFPTPSAFRRIGDDKNLYEVCLLRGILANDSNGRNIIKATRTFCVTAASSDPFASIASGKGDPLKRR